MELLRLVISITAMSFRWIPYGAGLQVEIWLIYEAYITIFRLCLSNKWRRYLQTHTTYYQIEWLNLFDRVYAYLFRFMDFLVSSVYVVRLRDAVLEWERQFKLENNNNYLSKTVSQWGFCQIHAQYVCTIHTNQLGSSEFLLLLSKILLPVCFFRLLLPLSMTSQKDIGTYCQVDKNTQEQIEMLNKLVTFY